VKYLFPLLLLILSVTLALALPGSYTPLDSFDRANQGPPPSAQWSNSLLQAQVGMIVTGNRLGASTAGSSVWWNVRTFPADVGLAVILGNATVSSLLHVRLYMRIAGPNTASTTGYICQAECATPPSGGTMVLRRLDTPISAPTLATQTNVAWAAGDGVGCEMKGTQICGYRRVSGTTTWTQLICATDATFSTAGFVGVGMNNIEITMDDFWAGSLRRKGRLLAFD